IATTCFVPENNLQRKAEKDRAPYPQWAEEGWIVPAGLDEIDLRVVVDHISDLCERFDVREVSFDPSYSFNVRTPLQEAGRPVVLLPQGWQTQGPAVADLEGVVMAGRVKWNSPVMRWCV